MSNNISKVATNTYGPANPPGTTAAFSKAAFLTDIKTYSEIPATATSSAPANEDKNLNNVVLFCALVPSPEERAELLEKASNARSRYLWKEGSLADFVGMGEMPSLYEFALVHYYAKHGFMVNRMLNNPHCDPSFRELAFSVNKLINKLSATSNTYGFNAVTGSDKGILYRGAEPYDPDFNTLKVGTVFQMKHFCSSSKDKAIAAGFANPNVSNTPDHPEDKGKGYMFVISKARGAILTNGMSPYDEGEVLLKAGHSFKVTKIVWETNVTAYNGIFQKKIPKMPIVYLEVVK